MDEKDSTDYHSVPYDGLNDRKKSDDKEKLRNLRKSLEHQIKVASKKDLKETSRKSGALYTYYFRENIVLIVTLVISILSIYFFWCTYNYWKIVRYKNILEPNSRALRTFKNVPMENMRLCITIFNYTNIDEYNINASTPFKVNNVGPYCFRDVPSKKNLVFNDNETELSYQENSDITFLQKESAGSLDDVVIVPNIPLLSVVHQVLEHSLVIRLGMLTKLKLNNYEPFLVLKVRSFLYGYDDDLLAWIYKVGSALGYPTGYSMQKFSLLTSIMTSINSNYTLNTGKSSLDELGDLKIYNKQSRMNVWKTDECNAFRGSYGAYWPPETVRQGGNVSFFNGLLCRNVPLVKEKDTRYANFISVVRYQSSPDLFTYPSDHEESCYCLEEPCIDNLFSVGKCLRGPFVLSYKNFHGVDREELQHIDFSNLTPPQHDDDWKTHFDIHPGLGNTMSFKTTFQMNLQVKKKAYVSEFPMRLEHGMILPAVIIERGGPHLNTKTNILLIVLSVVEGTFQYGSVILAFLTIFILIKRWRALDRLFYVHNVTVSPPIMMYQQAKVEPRPRYVHP
uniref:Scavenger receptor class B member 1 n=1 Tax=Cacopsylla melanoneura TaxID=428564 RepID=A0A8D8SYV6_9HEMI